MKFNNSHILSIAGLIVALSIGYYLVIFLPQKEKAKLEQVKAEQEARESLLEKNKLSLQECLDNVKKAQLEHWNKLCKAKGLKEECLQPLSIVELESKRSNTAREECFKKYPQK